MHCLCRRSALGAAALSLALVVAACGSYTKKNFIARADAICAHTLQQLRALPPPVLSGGERGRLTALARYLDRGVPLIRSEANQLLKLQRPSGSRAQRVLLERFLLAERQVAADYAALAQAAATGSPAAVSSAGAALRDNQVTMLSAQYGLLDCGSAGATVA
jgi:hypothetical protein